MRSSTLPQEYGATVHSAAPDADDSERLDTARAIRYKVETMSARGIRLDLNFGGFLAAAGLWWACAGPAPAAVVYRVNGKPLSGKITGESGSWGIAGTRVSARELLLIRFDGAPPPDRVPSGVFLRGGSLIAGTLEALRGSHITVTATSLGTSLKLKRADLAGAFFPLPPGQAENFPALGRYAYLLAALRNGPASGLKQNGNTDRALQPGRRDRVRYPNLDGLDGRLIRLGTQKAIIEGPGGKLETPRRRVLRLIECKVSPRPKPKRGPQAAGADGPEVIVRLKPGDILRGRVEQLDAKGLALVTRYAGKIVLPRETLAALYPAGGAGLTWLSDLAPVRNKFTPLFDADFPARMDLSCDGHMLRIGGLACDRGIGVHAKTELTYAVPGKPGLRFAALVGMDDETQGRGLAEAQVRVDGKTVWRSGPIRGGAAPKQVSVDLSHAKRLTLLVDFGPDADDSGDHVDWGWAALVGK